MRLEEPEIGSTDLNIPRDYNCMDHEPLFGMPGGCEADDDEGDEINKSDAIPTTTRRRRATTEIERFHLGTGDVDVYEGADGDDADADEEKESSQANDGLTQTLED
jgi:hypothetical protein